MAKANILLITGTDTGVGKTVVTSLLTAGIRAQGIKALAIKPVETGCARGDNGELAAADAAMLWNICNRELPYEKVNYYRFASPVAPIVATQVEARRIDPKILVSNIKSEAAQSPLLIVEGAGGLLVPISSGYTYAELAKDCDASVIVVVGSRLGAINHSLLTFEVLNARGIRVLGYVLNDLFQAKAAPARSSLLQAVDALKTNRELLFQMGVRYGIRELGVVPYLESGTNAASILKLADAGFVQEMSKAVVECFF